MITILAHAILQGGPFVPISFLLVIASYLYYQLKITVKKYDEKERQQKELFDKCIKSNNEITEALCDLKVLIAEIKGKITK